MMQIGGNDIIKSGLMGIGAGVLTILFPTIGTIVTWFLLVNYFHIIEEVFL